MSVGSRSDNGKVPQFWTQASKLRGPKVEVRQASTCKPPRAAERKWRRLVLAVTGTHKLTQLLEVLLCGMMATLEDDQAELENYPLWNWQPVKIVTKCRSYSIELALPHYESCS